MPATEKRKPLKGAPRVLGGGFGKPFPLSDRKRAKERRNRGKPAPLKDYFQGQASIPLQDFLEKPPPTLTGRQKHTLMKLLRYARDYAFKVSITPKLLRTVTGKWARTAIKKMHAHTRARMVRAGVVKPTPQELRRFGASTAASATTLLDLGAA